MAINKLFMNTKRKGTDGKTGFKMILHNLTQV